jgi:endonuclease/exonuclease/phosphatase family metal-dependent hydrolase
VALRQPVPDPHPVGRAQVPSVLAVMALPVAGLLVALPLLSGVADRVDAPGGFPVRVATYNVRLAFSADGRLNVEEVAAALGGARPDVVGLQEVPRGHLASGGVDMLGWLQRSLDLPYAAFQAATPGALHGNAILSRYPLRDVTRRAFRRSGTDLPRGVLAATVDLGDGARLRFLTAHLPPGGTLPERRRRVATVLEVWGGEPGTVVAADTNAPPGSTTMRDLAAAGLRPVWRDDADPGFTYPSDAPRAKIDWLLASPDLVASDVEVVLTSASDHLPLVARIDTPPAAAAGG